MHSLVEIFQIHTVAHLGLPFLVQPRSGGDTFRDFPDKLDLSFVRSLQDDKAGTHECKGLAHKSELAENTPARERQVVERWPRRRQRLSPTGTYAFPALS